MDILIDKIRNGQSIYYSKHIKGKNLEELRILRNTIFARHGYIFKSDDLMEVFKKYSWYNPMKFKIETTQIDKENLEYIMYREMESKINSIIKSPGRTISNEERQLVGIWQDFRGAAAGWGHVFIFYPNGIFVERFSQNDCSKRLLSKTGKWKYYNNELTLLFTHKAIAEGGRFVAGMGSCVNDDLVESRPTLIESKSTKKHHIKITPDKYVASYKMNNKTWYQERKDPYEY